MRLRTGHLLAPLLLGAVLAVPPANAAAAPRPTCQGERATIVGPNHGEREIRGTTGRDVVVTAGAAHVETRGGDDLVCVTRKHGRRTHDVFSGAGDDVVLVPRRHGGVYADLGRGADSFTGGSGSDTVMAGKLASAGLTDREVDLIHARGGDDRITVGEAGQVLADRVVTGAGNDRVEVSGSYDVASATLRLGAGVDVLDLTEVTLTGRAVLDNRIGRIVEDGVLRWTWAGAEALNAPRAAGGLDLIGGDADESVWAPDAVSADLGPGDDTLFTWLQSDAPATALSGGDGADQLWIETTSPITADLGARTLARPGLPLIGYASIEDLNVQSYKSVTVLGSDGPDDLLVRSCDVRADLGAGDDRIGVNSGGITLGTCTRTVRVDGGDGNDRVWANHGENVLLGGPGDDDLESRGTGDTANGGAGTDRCVAEIRIECER